MVDLKRWTRFFETFPVGPNRSIEFWTEISGNFGWMDRARHFPFNFWKWSPDLLSFPFLFSAIVCQGEWVLDLLIPRANGVWNMEGSCCSFDKNGRFLALLTPDGRLKLWDCTFGSLKHEYTSPSHLSTTCTCLRWSRTSRSSVSILVPGGIDHVFSK